MISINSEGGYIGPFWWRNKSPEFNWNIQMSDENAPWNHRFHIEGGFGFGSTTNFVRIGINDISLTEVSCQGEKLNLDRAPMVFVNIIKVTVLNAVSQVQSEITRDNQIQYLNTCLNKP